jgi:hypothetical protein
MDRKASPRSLKSSTRPNARQFLTHLHQYLLQHPALSHPAEPGPVHHSLDLSFQRGVSISTLDRQLIDDLGHAQPIIGPCF